MIHNDKLVEIIKHNDLIVFDGECVLCSGFFQFVLLHDKQERFSFAIAQSEFGEALYEYYDLKAEDYDTNLVFIDGKLYERLYGFFEVIKRLGWPWKALAVFKVLPGSFLDWSYYKIARNRYRLFGRRDECMVPDAAVKARFIDG